MEDRMSERPQSFENHAMIVFGYHRVASGLVVLLLGYFLFRTATDFSLDRLASVALVIAVALVGLYARVFALGVQDRVIRLEERMRMQRLFPTDLAGRIESFTTEQLIALRFASDTELVDLARRVLDERMADRKAIKRAIREWRADNQRI
jgi:hypothetical protein